MPVRDRRRCLRMLLGLGVDRDGRRRHRSRRAPRRRSRSRASTWCRSRGSSTRRTPLSCATRSRAAENRHSTLLVFQLDSGGAVDVDVAALTKRVHDARVPIAVWIGPSGATARGGAALFAAVGARCSRSRPVRTSGRRLRRASIDPVTRSPPSFDAFGRVHAVLGARRSDAAARRRRIATTRRDALAAHVVDRIDNVLGDLIVGLDNKTVRTAARPAASLDRRGRRCRQRTPPAAEPGRALREARPRRPGAAHARQPVGRVHALRRGPRADRVRVLHRVDRARRASPARSCSSAG